MAVDVSKFLSRNEAKRKQLTWVENENGNTDASTTRTFARPYTLRSASTTPPASSGSIAHVDEGWYSVPIVVASHASQSSSVCTLEPGVVSWPTALLSGAVWPILRASLRPSRSITRYAEC